jgi:hypothetical protein
MNPYELQRLAKQHTSELRTTAARRHAGAARHGHGRSIRHRTGWALVHVGLTLVSTSAARPGNGPARQGRSLPTAHLAR